MREFKPIDLSEYRHSGEGANGASYDSLTDPSVMMKLYNPGYDVEAVLTEYDIARKVFDLGVPSPEPGELVTDGERVGIRFRRIQGKRSFSRIFADEPGRTEEFARLFARKCRELHSLQCPEGLFPEAKEQFHYLLGQVKGLTGEHKKWLAAKIDATPDCTTALHGDMHFGNIISTLPAGAPLSTPHEIYFIDLGYFARGCPLFDLGMLMSIAWFSTPDFVLHDMHITQEHAARVAEFFLDEYFFKIPDPDGLPDHATRWFGPGQTLESVKKALVPYYCIKSLLIGYNIGQMLPEAVEAIDKLSKGE